MRENRKSIISMYYLEEKQKISGHWFSGTINLKAGHQIYQQVYYTGCKSNGKGDGGG